MPTSAPQNDLLFLERLLKYSATNKIISDGAVQKLLRHLWYLNEEMICLALFDPSVCLDDKRAMLLSMKDNPGNDDPPKRITLQICDLATSLRLSSFATQQSKRFLTALNLPQGFLLKDPSLWPDDDEYMTASKIVKALKVVNDTAERGVALIQEFNADLTRSEEQKQFLLQVVTEHRKLFPDSKKSTVVAELN